MLAIRLIPLMKASSSPRYQSSASAGTARVEGDPWGELLEYTLTFHWCISFGDSPSSKGDKSLSFHISSPATATQFLPLFPPCLYLVLCVSSLVFFSKMQTLTSFLLRTFLLVPMCLWLPAHLDTHALSSFRGKHQELLTFSPVPCTLCVTVPFLSDCLCHTYFSHHFSSRNDVFLFSLCLSVYAPPSPFQKDFASSSLVAEHSIKWCHFGLAADKEGSGCSPQCHWFPL